jgi:hypothetical protein
MLFMVVEHFRDNDMVPVYQRLRQGDPAGGPRICLRPIQAWVLEWRDYDVTFEIVPVITSAEARAASRLFSDHPSGHPATGPTG